MNVDPKPSVSILVTMAISLWNGHLLLSEELIKELSFRREASSQIHLPYRAAGS
jgi:hypothetical protein